MPIYYQTEQLAQDTTVSGVTTLTIPSERTTHIEIQPTVQDIYITLDNSTPSATNGFILKKDGIYSIPVKLGINTIKIIEATASATVNYQFLIEVS